MKVQDQTKPYDTINVTPMLDLAYVLLVVFILMTTATVQGLVISMPKPSNKPVVEKKHELLIILVTQQGKIMVNGVVVNPPELENLLLGAKSRDREMSVLIKGDPLTQYQRVMTVVDVCNKAQVNMGLVTSRIGT